MDKNFEKIFSQAHDIAVRDLRKCYDEGKILASLKNFSDFWARDTFYAILGVLEIGDWEIAKNCIEYFLSYQKLNGKIPRKICIDYNAVKYIFGKSITRKKPHPSYSGILPPFSCMDANALLVIAFSNYIEKSKDFEFGKRYYTQVKRAAIWYEDHLRNGFVQEYGLSNWMDVVFKDGNVLYTNVVYAESLKRLSILAKIMGENSDEEFFKKQYENIRKRINERFWNGNWYDDQLSNHTHFDVAGNVPSCYFEIAASDKMHKILGKLQLLKNDKLLLPTVDPKYPWWKVNPITYLFGMQDYQNGASWMWIDLFAVGAMQKNGFTQVAHDYFAQICEIILKNKAVHETYFNEGAPYKTRHWESAVPFAWGSGVFLKVYSEIVKN